MASPLPYSIPTFPKVVAMPGETIEQHFYWVPTYSNQEDFERGLNKTCLPRGPYFPIPYAMDAGKIVQHFHWAPTFNNFNEREHWRSTSHGTPPPPYFSQALEAPGGRVGVEMHWHSRYNSAKGE